MVKPKPQTFGEFCRMLGYPAPEWMDLEKFRREHGAGPSVVGVDLASGKDAGATVKVTMGADGQMFCEEVAMADAGFDAFHPIACPKARHGGGVCDEREGYLGDMTGEERAAFEGQDCRGGYEDFVEFSGDPKLCGRTWSPVAEWCDDAEQSFMKARVAGWLAWELADARACEETRKDEDSPERQAALAKYLDDGGTPFILGEVQTKEQLQERYGFTKGRLLDGPPPEVASTPFVRPDPLAAMLRNEAGPLATSRYSRGCSRCRLVRDACAGRTYCSKCGGGLTSFVLRDKETGW